MTYAEVYSRLAFEVAKVTFMKKNNEIRVMLCTRSLSTCALATSVSNPFGWHESKCSPENGNVAVFDLECLEARAFNIERIIDIEWLGTVGNVEKYNEVFNKFVKEKEIYMNSISNNPLDNM